MKIKEYLIYNSKNAFEKIRSYYKKDKILFIGVLILSILVILIILKYLFAHIVKLTGFTELSVITKQSGLNIVENSSNRLVLKSIDGCSIWIYKDKNIQNSLDSLKRDFPIMIKEYTKDNMIVYIGKHLNRSLYKMLMAFPSLEYSCVVLCYYENIDIDYENVCKTYKIV